jgi:beta-phosphoglucomutase-like phosphatase (HAD superfamily)
MFALEPLRCAPGDGLAIEDSPVGAAAALAAGIAVIVACSDYFPAGPLDGALAMGSGLDDRKSWLPAAAGPADVQRVGLAALRGWHALAHAQPGR